MPQPSFRSKQTLWTLYGQWKAVNRKPSEVLEIDYRWVADDLDQAVAWLGNHVRDEHERQVDALRKQRAPKPGAKKAGGSSHAVEDWEVDQLWQKTVARLVYDKRRVFIPAMNQKGGAVGGTADRRKMWWIENDWGDDGPVARNVRAGARKVFDADGTLRQEYNADGQLVWNVP